jgi:hypothetical protein
MGFLVADLFAAAIAMLIVGSIGLWLGPLPAAMAVGGILTVLSMRQARRMESGRPMNTALTVDSVTILDTAGKRRVNIDKKGIQLADEAERTRIVMVADTNRPEFQICDENGNPLVSLGSRPDGNSGLALMDQTGQIRAQAVIRKEWEGIASFGLYDSAGKLRGNFAISDKVAFLNFTRDDGIIFWRAPDETSQANR